MITVAARVRHRSWTPTHSAARSARKALFCLPFDTAAVGYRVRSAGEIEVATLPSSSAQCFTPDLDAVLLPLVAQEDGAGAKKRRAVSACIIN
jgi:hypothetical protein